MCHTETLDYYTWLPWYDLTVLWLCFNTYGYYVTMDRLLVLKEDINKGTWTIYYYYIGIQIYHRYTCMHSDCVSVYRIWIHINSIPWPNWHVRITFPPHKTHLCHVEVVKIIYCSILCMYTHVHTITVYIASGWVYAF